MSLKVEKLTKRLSKFSKKPNHVIIQFACNFFKDIPKKQELIDPDNKDMKWPNGVVQQWIHEQRAEQQKSIIHLDLTSKDALETLELIYLEQFCEE